MVRPVTNVLQHQGPHPAASWGAPSPSGENIGAGGTHSQVLHTHRAPEHSSSLKKGTHQSLRLRLRVLLSPGAALDGAEAEDAAQTQCCSRWGW